MAIISGELQLYYAAHRNQATPAANGGRPSNTAVRCGQNGNIWPVVTAAQRAAGQTLAEKLFWKNRNAAGDVGADPWVALLTTTGGDEYEWIVAGTQDDMQSDLTGSERKYAAAKLAADAAAGATSLSIALPNAALSGAFQSGDMVLIHAGGATYETAAVSAVSGSGTALTLTLSAGTANAWQAASAYVCSLYRPGAALAPSVSNITQSGAGSYDFTTYPLALDNRGTARQRWTLTYTAADALEVSGDEIGSLGAFSIADAISPLDGSGNPYFTLAPDGHGTAHVAGDVIQFDTYAAAIAVWRFKTTPAGCLPMGTTSTALRVQVESV